MRRRTHGLTQQRVAQVQTGDSTSIKSVTDVAYDAVGGMATGKVVKRSAPHLPGGTTYWKLYGYDVLGRLKSRTRPDGASSYSYAYAGNNTTVTDPTGKWKTFTTDAYGQLVEVQEPSPNPGSEPTHETFYAYDVFGHLIEVQMSRTVGGTVRTQFRTWAYNATTLQLTSKTSPEAGTVSYTYNTDGTLATVTDANSHRKVYSYDSYGRITQIARGAVSGSTFTEDVSQRTNYAYSGTNGGFSSATAGRVSQITYTGPHGLALKEWYSYHKAGAITTKRLNVTGTPFGSSSLNLDASYGYDDEGSVLSIQYPNSQFNSNGTTVSGPGYSYGYDTMERLQSMTDKANTPWAANTSYGPSNELLSFSANGFSETRSYNANVELTELVSGSNVHYKYNYSATQDNGQILSQTDVVSGEVTTYQYDTLQRLIKASATGDPSGAWSQSYTYDGFGNLNQVAASNAPALSVAIDTTTNRIQTSASYDANGNMTGYAGSGYGYDIENRTIQASPSSGGTVLYGYDTTNHRVYKGLYNGSTYSGEEIYFYGAEGHKYGTWQVNPSSGVLLQASVTKQWFGNRLVSPQDRLDSRGKYFPFGQERTNINPPNPANDQEKFASYTRDSATGLDYADQRYYNNLIGRFMRPDPFGGSANAYVPQTWNRYAYVGNDPANNFDPNGLDDGGVFEYGDQVQEPGPVVVDPTPTIVNVSATPDPVDTIPTVTPVGGGTSSGGSGGSAPITVNPSASEGSSANPSPYGFASTLSSLVAARLISDCNALVDFASYVNSTSFDTDSLVAAFGALTPTQPATQFAGIASMAKAASLNPTGVPSGYLAPYQNVPASDTSDQGHHFAAFFQYGYLAGAVTGTAAATQFEVAEAAYHMVQVNTGDINLGIAAVNLGAELRSGQISRFDLANDIRNQLCNEPQ